MSRGGFTSIPALCRIIAPTYHPARPRPVCRKNFEGAMNREDCCPFPLLHEINSPKFNQPNQHHSGDEKMRIDKLISAIAFAMLVSLTILLPTSATAQATRAASPKFS